MGEKYLCKNLGVIEGGGRLLEGGVFLGTYITIIIQTHTVYMMQSKCSDPPLLSPPSTSSSLSLSFPPFPCILRGGKTWCHIVATFSVLWWHSKGRNRGCKLQGSLYRLSYKGCIGFSTKLKLRIWLVKNWLLWLTPRRPKLVCCQIGARWVTGGYFNCKNIFNLVKISHAHPLHPSHPLWLCP